MEGTMSIYPGMLLTYLSSSGVGFVGVGRDVREESIIRRRRGIGKLLLRVWGVPDSIIELIIFVEKAAPQGVE